MRRQEEPPVEWASALPKLRRLTLQQVLHLDELLASLGDYGEVHLIVQRGQLRYINKIESFKAWKEENER